MTRKRVISRQLWKARFSNQLQDKRMHTDKYKAKEVDDATKPYYRILVINFSVAVEIQIFILQSGVPYNLPLFASFSWKVNQKALRLCL